MRYRRGIQSAFLLVAVFLVLTPGTLAANILGLFINGHRSHMLVYSKFIQLLLEGGHNVTVVSCLDLEGLVPTDLPRWHHIKLPLKYVALENALSDGVGDSGSDQLSRMLQRIEDTSRFMDDPIWRAFLADAGNTYDLLLLGYLFNDYQLAVAAHFQCPAALIWTGQPISFINSLMGNPEERTYVTQPYDRNQYTGLQAVAFGVFEKIVEFMALKVLQRIHAKYFDDERYPDFEAMRKNVSVAFCNHHSLSEGPIAPYVPGIIEVGGIQHSIGTDKFATDSNRPSAAAARDFIFLSFGTRIKWTRLPSEFTQKFLNATHSFPGINFYWTYEGDCRLLTEGVENIHCASWWPQSELLGLPTARIFITHGGKGSINEAMQNGVPLLGLPLFGDQHANVKKMVQQGLGLHLDVVKCKTAELVEAINQLLQDRTYADNIGRFSRLYRDRPMTAARTTLYWIEYVIRHRGAPHIRSPLVSMSFIEYYSIDVVFFLMSAYVAVILVCLWLEQKLEKLAV